MRNQVGRSYSALEAALVGAAAWRNAPPSQRAADLMAAAFSAGALVALATHAMSRVLAAPIAGALFVALALTAGLFEFQTSRRAGGWLSSRVRVSARAAAGLRVVVFASMVGLWLSAKPPRFGVSIWLFGIVLASDVFRTLTAIGHETYGPRRVAALLIGSPFHVGAVVSLAALAATRTLDIESVLTVYGAIASTGIAGFVTYLVLARVSEAHGVESVVAATAQKAVVVERFDEFVHQQLAAQLTVMRERIADGSMDTDAIVRELSDVELMVREHRLELNFQLSTVEIARVFDPYLVWMARLGIQVGDTPDIDICEQMIDADVARLVAVAYGTFVSNAAKAQATRIDTAFSFDEGAGFRLAVVDNGYGFDPNRRRRGGGLDLLDAKLDTPVFIESDAGRTTAVAMIPSRTLDRTG